MHSLTAVYYSKGYYKDIIKGQSPRLHLVDIPSRAGRRSIYRSTHLNLIYGILVSHIGIVEIPTRWQP